jgi:hypothetical protein
MHMYGFKGNGVHVDDVDQLKVKVEKWRKLAFRRKNQRDTKPSEVDLLFWDNDVDVNAEMNSVSKNIEKIVENWKTNSFGK